LSAKRRAAAGPGGVQCAAALRVAHRFHAAPENCSLWRGIRTGGPLRVDEAVVKAKEKLDGKCLLRSSGPPLLAEDIALGHKQLWQVERGWRDMRQIL
jgi:hypothetical protein